MSDVLFYLIDLGLNTGLLMAALWIMLKFQDLNYNFLGLLGTAALGSGLDMIPFVGHAFAVVALYFCITKMTCAPWYPDGIFTVAIAYAIKFLANMLLLTSLVGDLRPDLHSQADDFPPRPASQPKLVPPEVVKTNLPVVASNSAPAVPVAAVAAAAPVAPPPVKHKTADEIIQMLAINGVTQNGGKSVVTFKFSGKNQTLFLGETTSLSVEGKLVPVKLEKVDDHTVTFKINGELAGRSYN